MQYRWVVLRVSLAQRDATYETAASAVIWQDVVSITLVSYWGGPSMVGWVGIEGEVGESGVENRRSTSHAVKWSFCILEEWKWHSRMRLIAPWVSCTTSMSMRTSSNPSRRWICGRMKIISPFLVELRSIVGPWMTGLLIEGCKGHCICKDDTLWDPRADYCTIVWYGRHSGGVRMMQELAWGRSACFRTIFILFDCVHDGEERQRKEVLCWWWSKRLQWLYCRGGYVGHVSRSICERSEDREASSWVGGPDLATELSSMRTRS